jgi:hypothetical protein
MIVSQVFDKVSFFFEYLNRPYNWCSKLCIIGLIIGLSIGAIITIIVALPLGLSIKSAFGKKQNKLNNLIN